MCLAIPGRLIEIHDQDALHRTGLVDFDGVKKTISLVCVPEAKINDYLLVHVGMAISIVDEQHAQSVLDYLNYEQQQKNLHALP